MKIKNKKLLKNLLLYLSTIVISISIFILFLIIKKIQPFGKNALAYSDAFYQYKPFLYNFIMKLKKGTLLNYTFKNFLGYPFFFEFMYYLSSPINLFCLFFKTVDSMFLFNILVKLCFGAICSTFYFKKKLKNNTYMILLFSLSYIFSGWFLAYYYSILWLDVFMFFPLYQYFLEKLFDDKKILGYVFGLALIILFNFFFAMHICFYTLIYLMTRLIIEKMKYMDKLKRFWLFGGATFLSFLLISFFLYPVFDSFTKIGIVVSNYATAKCSLFSFFKSFLMGTSNINILAQNGIVTNVCVNSFILINFIYFCFEGKTNKKSLIIFLILFVLLTFSKKFYFIVNGFYLPAGYYYRFSYIFSFWMIYFALKNYISIKEYSKLKLLLSFMIVLIISLLSYFFADCSLGVVVFNIVFVFIFLVLLSVYKKGYKLIEFIILILIIIETIISVSFLSTFSIDSNNKFVEVTKTYRSTETGYGISESIEGFSSTSYLKVLKLLNDLGEISDIKSSVRNTISEGNTMYFDMIFNIDGQYKLNKLFGVSDEITNVHLSDEVIENQNILIQKFMNSKEDYFDEFSFDSCNDGVCKLKIRNDGIYFLDDLENFMYLYVNGNLLKKHNILLDMDYKKVENVDYDSMISFEAKKGDLVELSYFMDKEDVIINLVNEKKFEDVYNQLKQNELSYTYYQDNHIEGDIEIDENQIIFTSIPYDTNWHVYVDGKEVKSIKLLDALLGIECGSGKHHVAIKYKSNYRVVYIISGITFLSIIVGVIIKKKREKK